MSLVLTRIQYRGNRENGFSRLISIRLNSISHYQLKIEQMSQCL